MGQLAYALSFLRTNDFSGTPLSSFHDLQQLKSVSCRGQKVINHWTEWLTDPHVNENRSLMQVYCQSEGLFVQKDKEKK